MLGRSCFGGRCTIAAARDIVMATLRVVYAAAVDGRLARLVRFVCAPELTPRVGSDLDEGTVLSLYRTCTAPSPRWHARWRSSTSAAFALRGF